MAAGVTEPVVPKDAADVQPSITEYRRVLTSRPLRDHQHRRNHIVTSLQTLRPQLMLPPSVSRTKIRLLLWLVKIAGRLLLHYGEEMRVVIQYVMPVVRWSMLDLYDFLTSLGLYYKLHGVHRPVTMKKSVIKRRKRVVPASQGTQASEIASTTMGSPEPDLPSPSEEAARGTINPDGSVNLGLRIRDDQGRSLLPDPVQSSRGQNGLTSDLTAYSSSSHSHTHDRSDSLNNENRLPPMTSYPPAHQRPSVSPHSFLSPSRKRSFSTTEMEQLPPISDNTNASSTQPKRLSSIKSILNPGYTDPESDIRSERRSPGQYRGSQSPNLGYASSSGTGGTSREREREREQQSESDRSKMERREMLKLEAERMREALKAKERELEELGMGE